MIGIINYRAGNLQNLKNSLDYVGVKSEIIDSPEQMKGKDKLILPGVGAFGHSMANFKKHGFYQPVQQKIAEGVPLLGICVGMQLLFSQSNEDGLHDGLGIVEGQVRRFKTDLKVPQIGWNTVEFLTDDPLFKDIPQSSWFYFVHSYACSAQDSNLMIGTTEYGEKFCSIVRKDNVWGVQFHPEKSQNQGLKLLENFAQM